MQFKKEKETQTETETSAALTRAKHYCSSGQKVVIPEISLKRLAV